ncbi:MAG TPA: sorbosone dehydrogenase family protein, partial [Anaerolineae bacterium]|nr:sorbosone dehydrogenase family protein [Anaerolineae bacterium]
MSQRLMVYWLVMILIILALAACAGANQYSSSASTPVLQAEAEPEAATQAAELPYEITLPPGFEISLYASDVPNARSLALSPNGTLFVGTRTAGNLYAVLDHNQDYQADEVITLQRGMNSPNGVALRDGALYVAEINRI